MTTDTQPASDHASGIQARASGVPPLPLTTLSDGNWHAVNGKPYALYDWLRENEPVAWVEPENVEPFWAVSRWEDIRNMESQSGSLFLASPRILMDAKKGEPTVEGQEQLLAMDPPKHTKYRNILKSEFTVHGVSKLAPVVATLAEQMCEAFVAVARSGQIFDFVDIARTVPLYAMGRLIGLTDPVAERCAELSDIFVNGEGPEGSGPERQAYIKPVVEEFGSYFMAVMAERTSAPGDDLVTSLLKSAHKSPPDISEADVLSYLTLLLVAGNDTTRGATAGGLKAFADHPGELRRLQADMSLMPTAVDEILRWTTPVIHLARVAARDTEIRGVKIAEGDALAMIYASGNRDERVFENPYEFLVDRRRNPHLSFGFGPHTCMGANFARIELTEIFRRLVPLIDEVEVLDLVHYKSNVNSGAKTMQVRVKLFK